MIKKLIKKILLPILHILREAITLLRSLYHFTKTNIKPAKIISPPNAFSKSCYDMFHDDEMKNCYNTFKKYFYTSVFLDKDHMKAFAIQQAVENDKNSNMFYLEFGVGRGTSTNLFSKFLKENKLYGFDSFVGLKENWVGHVHYPAGSLSQKGIIPKLKKNIVPIEGWIQNTLPNFLKEKKPKVNFIHIDCDTYETTKFILENIKPYINTGCIILFDEFFNFPGWSVGEYKALIETFKEDEYEYLAFSYNKGNVTIKITK